MDKVKRLMSYSAKDYTEKIDFPVELVGRDGVVRKYSYADSVRIYERRIESAHVRYHDPVVAGREIDHCTKRIEQLRRSWRELIRSSERQYMEQHPGNQSRELYERGKEFLTQYIDERVGSGGLMVHGPPHLANLEELEHIQTFYVDWPAFYQGTLLYVFRLPDEGREHILSLYNELIERLRLHHQAPDTEKLVHCEQTRDVAFVLTCSRPDVLVRRHEPMRVVAVQVRQVPTEPGEEEGEVPWFEKVMLRQSDEEPGPYARATEALRRNDLEASFEAFREALDENPHHREAYWVLGALSDVLNRWIEGESYLLMGTRYFPEDARIHYYYGIALFRRSAWKAARDEFESAVKLQLKVGRAYGFLACTHVLTGSHQKALHVLEAALKLTPRDQVLLKLSVPLIRAIRLQRQSLAMGFLAIVLSGAMAWVLASPLTWTLFAAATLVVTVFYVLNRRAMSVLLTEWAQPSPTLLPE